MREETVWGPNHVQVIFKTNFPAPYVPQYYETKSQFKGIAKDPYFRPIFSAKGSGRLACRAKRRGKILYTRLLIASLKKKSLVRL